VERYAGTQAVIAYGGTVGRSENRAMLRCLRVRPVPSDHLDYSQFDFVCVVDTQPATGYASLPEGIVPHVILDHHPLRAPVPGALLLDVEPEVGSTCTLVGEMLLGNGVPVPELIATALVYGIKAETRDLSREAGSRDEEVFTALYPLASKPLLSRIASQRAPERYFREFALALQVARIHGDVVVGDLGEVSGPDIVHEAADFLLRLEGMQWSCVAGAFRERLYISLRASSPALRAGQTLRRVLRGMGPSGGHGAMAGGQVSLEGMTAEERDAASKEFFNGLLVGLHRRDVDARPLVPPRSAL
jgi:nanoRNase/pAp phosphatase (c-di-AMP/oligoRNAs hydrolase)